MRRAYGSNLSKSEGSNSLVKNCKTTLYHRKKPVNKIKNSVPMFLLSRVLRVLPTGLKGNTLLAVRETSSASIGLPALDHETLGKSTRGQRYSVGLARR